VGAAFGDEVGAVDTDGCGILGDARRGGEETQSRSEIRLFNIVVGMERSEIKRLAASL